MKKLIVISIVAALAAFTSIPAGAQDKKEAPAEKKAPTEKKAPATAARGLPASGKITSVDKTAKTIKVGERVFAITDTTRIQKAGKKATIEDATTGEEVGIYYKEADGGKLELISLRIGPRPERPPAPADKKKE